MTYNDYTEEQLASQIRDINRKLPDRNMTAEKFGRINYEAYCKHTDWKSLVSGDHLLPWAGLKREIQEAWIAAANTVVEEVFAPIYVFRWWPHRLCTEYST